MVWLRHRHQQSAVRRARACSEAKRMSEQPSSDRHRHSWKIVRYETTVGGRLKEHLRCKFCEARKGRYTKRQKQ